MLLVSQNLLNYMTFPDDVVVRINLAWVDNVETLKDLLSTFNNKIFLDLPIGRTKPPNNSYTLDELKNIFVNHKNIKYLAISNVDCKETIEPYVSHFGDSIVLVPKIESKKGVDNISEITSSLVSDKIVMLDHDDLFTDLVKQKIPPSDFFSFIKKMNSYCSKNSIQLLKTRGVIFSDIE